VHRSVIVASAVLLAGAVLAPVRAQTTSTPENVLQFKTTLTNPKVCGSQFDAANQYDPSNPQAPASSSLTIAKDLNYQIQAGDRLAYDVLIPKESTVATGGVDLTFSTTPRAKGSGATLGESFVGVDRFGQPAVTANYDLLSAQTTQVCDSAGKASQVPVFQRGQWLHREIDLSALRIDASGQPVMIKDVSLAFNLHDVNRLIDICPTDTANANAIALFRNVNIVNIDANGQRVIKKAIFNGEANLPTGQPSLNQGTFTNTTGETSVVSYTTTTNP